MVEENLSCPNDLEQKLMESVENYETPTKEDLFERFRGIDWKVLWNCFSHLEYLGKVFFDEGKGLYVVKRKEKIKSYDLNELIKTEYKPLEFWIDGFLLKNGITIIGGKISSFKSLFCLDLGLSLVKGGKFLGKFDVIGKPRILYYDLENPKQTKIERIKYLLKGDELGDNEANRLIFREDFEREYTVKEFEYAKTFDVIIFDSYRRFLKGKENDSAITDQFYRDFLKPLIDLGKCVIIIHHFKKQRFDEEGFDMSLEDQFRGSSDIVAQVDVALCLFKEDEVFGEKKTSFNVNVFKAKNRNGIALRNFSFYVLKDDVEKKTFINYVGEKRFENSEIGRINNIIDCLKDGEKRTYEIMGLLPNLSSATITRLLKAGLDRGMIKSDKKGHYRLPQSRQERLENDTP